MRILWVTNQPVPSIATISGMTIGVGSGWLNEVSKQLSEQDILGMIFPIAENEEYREGLSNFIQYYAVPLNKKSIKPNERKIVYFENIIKKFKPDVIHIWGTEYVHSFMAAVASQNLGMLDKVVVSIQGLVSVYARHFYGFIEDNTVRIPTLKNIYFRDSLRRQCKDFVARGQYECSCIKMVSHVIGRTDWDKACTTQLNPQVNYHVCNETLRNAFFERQWKLNDCEKHSLFVSQCQYPIKGLHHALEALAILIEKWKDVHLYTTGRNLLHESFKERMFDGDYEHYIRGLIKKWHLEEHITFLGRLEEKEMCERFCRSHVFISASSIENSPNSVGEAMCLGVPVVASDVGGVKNLLKHEEEGFIYQADAPYMLAHYVSRIFESDQLAEGFSKNGRKHALQTHNKEKNLENLLEIYNSIISMTSN